MNATVLVRGAVALFAVMIVLAVALVVGSVPQRTREIRTPGGGLCTPGYNGFCP